MKTDLRYTHDKPPQGNTGMGIVRRNVDFRWSQFWPPRILFSALAEPLLREKKSEKRDQNDRLVHRPTSPLDLRVQYALVIP